MFIWEPVRNKKRDGRIFFPPIYVNFSNRDGKSRRDEVIYVPSSWVWNQAGVLKLFLRIKIFNKITLPNSILDSIFRLIQILYFFSSIQLLWEIKSTNVFDPVSLIRKVDTQKFSCNLFLLSCWECSKYIIVRLVGFSKNHIGRDYFSNIFRLKGL